MQKIARQERDRNLPGRADSSMTLRVATAERRRVWSSERTAHRVSSATVDSPARCRGADLATPIAPCRYRNRGQHFSTEQRPFPPRHPRRRSPWSRGRPASRHNLPQPFERPRTAQATLPSPARRGALQSQVEAARKSFGNHRSELSSIHKPRPDWASDTIAVHSGLSTVKIDRFTRPLFKAERNGHRKSARYPFTR